MRLIDADVLMKNVRNLINRMPTAYDDWVVEQLEKRLELYEPMKYDRYFEGAADAYKKAIEIVKGCGADANYGAEQTETYDPEEIQHLKTRLESLEAQLKQMLIESEGELCSYCVHEDRYCDGGCTDKWCKKHARWKGGEQDAD